MREILAHVETRQSDEGVIACAQRPLPGKHTWIAPSVGNGVYYAVGDLQEYEKVWEKLDATVITYMSDFDILFAVWDKSKKLNLPDDKIPYDQICELIHVPYLSRHMINLLGGDKHEKN